MPSFQLAVRCAKGPMRAHNEDAARADAALGLLMVADGAGASQPAEEIGPFVLQHIEERLRAHGPPSDAALLSAILSAERAYLALASEDICLEHAGCTLALAWLDPPTGAGWLAHVGDCRAWRWRGGQATQLTQDHTLVQRMVEQGRLTPEEARSHPHRRVVLRMLGVGDDPVSVEITELRLRPDDRLLLCTDGLLEAAQAERLGEALSGPIEAAADQLMADAFALDGSDNAALALARWR